MGSVSGKRTHIGRLVLVALIAITTRPSMADQQQAMIQNKHLSVAVSSQSGSFEIRMHGSKRPNLQSGVAVEIDRHWLKSGDFPHFKTVQSTFSDSLGKGQMLTTSYWGLADGPTLTSILRVYDELSFGDAEVEVKNSTGRSITVQAIRGVDAIGSPRIDLGGHEYADRVLSDSFSEDRPVLRIADLGHATAYEGFTEKPGQGSSLHRAAGSQLIYNLESGQSILLAALTSQRFLTILHLQSSKDAEGRAVISSWTVDSTGTTEIAKSEALLKDAPAESQVELSLSLEPSAELASERLLFSVGNDYHSQLEEYGRAVRQLHHARVESDAPNGWWSWITWNGGITAAAVLTNAQWLARNAKNLGYRYVLIDEGSAYARGEYTTANSTQFPEGIGRVTRRISELGLVPGIWTAPFEVSERAWIFEHHKDWLVRNLAGTPIRCQPANPEPLYILDTTNPGAQEYLRRTYRTLAQDWGIKYIKLDFMDDSAVEGVFYRPDTTALEAQRIGLEVIRESVGDDVLIDKDGSPMLNPVGLVDEGRVSTDTDQSFMGSKRAASGIAARYYMHRNFFINDPDAFSVSRHGAGSSDPLLPPTEAEVGIVLAAVSGSMFEIGGDLTMLSGEPERLALIQNRDLLQMIALNRASVPLDLMSYAPKDEQPSVFLLHEDKRQSMLAVFNWTDASRSHSLRLETLGFPKDSKPGASDVLHPNVQAALNGSTLELRDQHPHSVRLIRLTDESVPAAAPSLSANVPKVTGIGEAVKVSACAAAAGVPALAFHWDFGDGITADGARATHAYSIPGVYTITVSAEGVDGISAKQTASISVSGAIDNNPQLEKNRRFVGDGSCPCGQRDE